MNFFKKLFSSKKESEIPEETEGSNFTGIYSTEYFDTRYKEESINPEMLDGCQKMIESYFIDNKIDRKDETLINHPSNLDQVDREGFGFVLYCKAFQMEEGEATLFLAYAFSDYLINKYGFRIYKDLKPEYPLRGMTLKYDKDGVVLSLYPFEYASKVLTGSQTFSELDEKINAQIGEMPAVNELINKFIHPENND